MPTPAELGEQAAKRDSYRHMALTRLAEGYKQDLVEHIEGDERLMDTLHELITDFIDEKLDVIQDDDAKLELVFLLLDRVALKSY